MHAGQGEGGADRPLLIVLNPPRRIDISIDSKAGPR